MNSSWGQTWELPKKMGLTQSGGGVLASNCVTLQVMLVESLRLVRLPILNTSPILLKDMQRYGEEEQNSSSLNFLTVAQTPMLTYVHLRSVIRTRLFMKHLHFAV